jgi:hypothetical protein
MQDEIILPDGDAIEKLAEEYRKIQPKKFARKVEVLSRPKPVKICEEPYDEKLVAELSLTLADSYQKSFVLLKRMISGTQNAVTAERFTTLLAERENSLKMLSKLGLYGQNSVFACKSTPVSAPPRIRFNNLLFDEVVCFDKLLKTLPKGSKRSAIQSLQRENLRQTVRYLLTIF